MGSFENYEEWATAESALLASTTDEEIVKLYRAAKAGDKAAEKTLGRMAIAHFWPPLRPTTPREQLADRAFKIILWLKNNTKRKGRAKMTAVAIRAFRLRTWVYLGLAAVAAGVYVQRTAGCRGRGRKVLDRLMGRRR
jgi:hypothetical protein